jgi:hypothetical protein|tara:strand:- start:124 stop:345 length:222 start_codon:yes stop_codon:yes gene_type:complete
VSGLAIITEAGIKEKDRACVEPCPVQCIYEFGAIYSADNVPDGTPRSNYSSGDPHTGHDHRYFIELSRNVFAD